MESRVLPTRNGRMGGVDAGNGGAKRLLCPGAAQGRARFQPQPPSPQPCLLLCPEPVEEMSL